MKDPFKYAVALVAVIPGLSNLLGAITLPQDEKWLFTGLTTIVPPMLVLMVMMFWKEIKTTPRTKLLYYGLAGLFLFVTLLLVFYSIDSVVVIQASTSEHGYDKKPVLFPFRLSGDFAAKVDNAGGPQAFVSDYGPDTAIEQIARMPGGTTGRAMAVIVLALLMMAFASIIAITFALFWFYFTNPGPPKP